MIQIDCAKELSSISLASSKNFAVSQKDRVGVNTHMVPPSSLICAVTTASPSQIIAKTPENTALF
jgi:hypothetical protein